MSRKGWLSPCHRPSGLPAAACSLHNPAHGAVGFWLCPGTGIWGAFTALGGKCRHDECLAGTATRLCTCMPAAAAAWSGAGFDETCWPRGSDDVWKKNDGGKQTHKVAGRQGGQPTASAQVSIRPGTACACAAALGSQPNAGGTCHKCLPSFPDVKYSELLCSV